MFTNQTVRPASLGPDQVVSFGESRNGAAPRITAWFPGRLQPGPPVHLPQVTPPVRPPPAGCESADLRPESSTPRIAP